MSTKNLDHWIAVPVEVADDAGVVKAEENILELVEALNGCDKIDQLSLLDKLKDAKQALRTAVVKAKRLLGDLADSARIVDHWGIVTEDDSRGQRNYRVVVAEHTVAGGQYFFGKGRDQDERSDQIDRQ